ncbi:HDOD domain-containing protein [Aquisalimonas lutea]|uniref:HDOD domain-containing protein n=1 Tax=Aquisalimonas lutea TaxID=1327750 RepID=UPI0025B41C58|nr:HDOD domain-containing protein [Aquisalimonas lutea]MDN3516868.1 HDOD domain-containing protein [Aquisalimonas lutea]
MNRATDTSTEALERWLERLDDRDLPILNRTVQRLCQTTADTEASTQDLATVVLQDPSLTSGVLRAANSAYFNRSGQEISTVSRAVVLLGFDTVHTIGISLTVLDTLLRGATRERLVRIMRESVFAAAQARLLAREQGAGGSEEVFVAALLLRLGEMAFWCFSDEPEARAMERGLANESRSQGMLEREILGFRLRELTGYLARSWHLGDLVERALQARQDATQGQIGCIRMGHRLEAVIREHGWRGAETDEVLQQIVRRTGVPQARAKTLLNQARDESQRIAEAFGIPAEWDQGGRARAGSETQAEGPRIHRPAPVLQLKILRELSVVMREQPSTHTVLEMILEGLHRGVGMDRTVITIYNQERTALRVKYSVGDVDGSLGVALADELSDSRMAVVRTALQQQRLVQLMDVAPEDHERWQVGAFQHRIRGMDAVLVPLVIRRREIGLIYTDRIPSQRLLDAEAVDSVLHFADQANLALEHITASS